MTSDVPDDPTAQRAAERQRGRPRESERESRRNEALAAALIVLVEHGYDRMTMQEVARRARSSKESLYGWFGGKDAMVAELIRHQAAQTNAAITAGLTADRDPLQVLVAVAENLQALLLGPASLALNRAAMSSPTLAELLLAEGRHRSGPLVENYLAGLDRAGLLTVLDPADAFRVFYGLVIQDAQIRALLGEPAPSSTERTRHAKAAVDRFVALHPGTTTGESPNRRHRRWPTP
jgi:AcrR family transcriptional regulator